MKNLLLLLIVLLTSCSVTKNVYFHNTTCGEADRKLTLAKILVVCNEEQLNIQVIDYNNGLLVAESTPEFSFWTGFYVSKGVNISTLNDTLVYTANLKVAKKGVFGGTQYEAINYLDSNTHTDWAFYWKIRKEIETYCKNKIEMRTTIFKKNLY